MRCMITRTTISEDLSIIMDMVLHSFMTSMKEIDIINITDNSHLTFKQWTLEIQTFTHKEILNQT